MARGDSLLFQPTLTRKGRSHLASFDDQKTKSIAFNGKQEALMFLNADDYCYLDRDGRLWEGDAGEDYALAHVAQNSLSAYGSRRGLVWQGDDRLVRFLHSSHGEVEKLPGIPTREKLQFFLSNKTLYAFDDQGRIFFSTRSKEKFAPWQMDQGEKIERATLSPQALLLDSEQDGQKRTLLVHADGSLYSESRIKRKKKSLFATAAPGRIIYFDRKGKVSSFSFAAKKTEKGKSQVLFDPKRITSKKIKQIEADSEFIYLLDKEGNLFLVNHHGRLLDKRKVSSDYQEMEITPDGLCLKNEEEALLLPIRGREG